MSQLLGPSSRAHILQLLKSEHPRARLHNRRGHHKEKPVYPQLESNSHSLKLVKACIQQGRPSTKIINKSSSSCSHFYFSKWHWSKTGVLFAFSVSVTSHTQAISKLFSLHLQIIFRNPRVSTSTVMTAAPYLQLSSLSLLPPLPPEHPFSSWTTWSDCHFSG